MEQKELNQFYIDQYNEHGDTPKGVGWNDEKRAEFRYIKTASMIPTGSTVVEYGPGNGIYAWRLIEASDHYTAVEPIEPYLNSLKEKVREYGNMCCFVNQTIEDFTANEESGQHDWGIAIGVFALKLNSTNEAYMAWCYRCIINMLYKAKKGIIINAFQDNVDFTNDEQFYFNISHLVKFLADMDYHSIELVVKPAETPHEFFIKILKVK